MYTFSDNLRLLEHTLKLSKASSQSMPCGLCKVVNMYMYAYTVCCRYRGTSDRFKVYSRLPFKWMGAVCSEWRADELTPASEKVSTGISEAAL